MWLAPLVSLVALAADPSPATATAAAAAAPQPIYTRQTYFAIPFRVDQPIRNRNERWEVQLYVSGDRGTRWDFYARTEPERKQFLFRAGNDGEFWFQVQTKNPLGQVRPDAIKTPGLRVVVDTAPPKVQLEARRGEGGQVVARWQVDDANPKLDSLKIQYRTGPQMAWQNVPVTRQDIRTTGTVQSSEVTWMPPVGATRLEIRAEVSDLAGNPAVNQAQLALEAGRTASTSPPGAPPSAANQTPVDPKPSATTAARAPGDGWRPGSDLLPGGSGPAAASGPAPARDPAAAPAAAQKSGPPLGPPPASIPAPVNPPIANTFRSSEPNTGGPGSGAATAPINSVPPGQTIEMVNVRAFQLGYDAQAVGPSGIGRVELWGTRDQGRTWRSFGSDEDRQSPIVVTVTEEGVYGFRIVLTSGAGLGGKPPQSGEAPEKWVGVDLTKPTGRITGVEPGTGSDAGKLNITWEAADNIKLATRPVSLSYGPTLGGPWTAIASGLENTGRYTWTADSGLSRPVYLRLEVRDEARNVTTYDTPEPISLERAAPTARIRDIRPLGQTGTPGEWNGRAIDPFLGVR